MRKTIAGVYAALILVLCALPARADCRRAACAPYVAPHVTYTPYVPPVYHDNHVVAVPVAIIPSTFYSVSPELIQARLIAIASEDAARKAVAEFAARYGLPVAPVAPPPGPPAPPAPPDGPVPPLAARQGAVSPIPAASGADPAGPLAVAQAMSASKCAKCHKPGSERMQLDFARLTGPELEKVHFRLTTGSKKVMPPAGHPKATDAELDAVDALLAAAN